MLGRRGHVVLAGAISFVLLAGAVSAVAREASGPKVQASTTGPSASVAPASEVTGPVTAVGAAASASPATTAPVFPASPLVPRRRSVSAPTSGATPTPTAARASTTGACAGDAPAVTGPGTWLVLGSTVRAVAQPVRAPVWSPTGQEVAAIATAGPGHDTGIVVIGRDGSVRPVFTPPAPPSPRGRENLGDPQWSRTGRYLVFVNGDEPDPSGFRGPGAGEQQRLVVHDRTTGATRVLASGAASSPWFLLGVGTDAVAVIQDFHPVLIPLAGGDPKVLSTAYGYYGNDYHGRSFSPDGRYLAVRGGDGGSSVFDLASGAETHVGLQGATAIDWSPDGTQILWRAIANDRSIVRTSVTGGAATVVIHESGVPEAVFARDGSVVYSRRSVVMRTSSDDTASRVLGPGAQVEILSDGRILHRYAEPSQGELCTFGPSGAGPARALLRLPGAPGAPAAVSASGDAILVARPS